MSQDQPTDLRSFGRRKGRAFSARQKALWDEVLPGCRFAPELALEAQIKSGALEAQLEGTSVQAPVWLEIGFGGGEHLLWQARQNPAVQLIGAEPFVDGVVKVLDQIDRARPAFSNIKLYPDDVRTLLRALPDASLSRVFILFPDPWPKKKHVKRRLVSPTTLHLLSRVMRDGAELRVATDIGDYARTILLALRNSPAFRWPAQGAASWRERPADWPPTRYEAKAFREGRQCAYFTFQRATRRQSFASGGPQSFASGGAT
ncbi:MAG: tRNA (guanine(46)-N(7))-methyltransferase TrmB [Pseudomonadota bacterium]